MKKQYFEKNDKVYVTDTRGNIRCIDRTDKIGEKLQKENELEMVKKEIDTTNEVIQEINDDVKWAIKYLKHYLIIPLGAIPGIVLISGLLYGDMLSGIAEWLRLGAALEVAGCMFVGCFAQSDFKTLKSKNKLTGYQKKLELLESMKEEIEKELEYIKSNEKEINDLSDSKIVNITTEEKAKEIKLISYYSKNLNELKKWYNNDKLQEYLKEQDVLGFDANYIISLLENDIENDNTYIDSELEKTNKKGIFAKFKRTTKK